ncbi:MAG: DUF11 domain-containing protein [Planctomycetes bacterium]|nr:DUF11 domain-containing protein [Planctomycetota bacterium]
MRCSRVLLALLLGLLFGATAHAQFPYNQPIPPPGPLMYVRFVGPKGAKIAVYRGVDQGQTLEMPCTVGFRPGYAYRLAIFDIPGIPQQVFSPTLEVHGTLALTPKMRNADFPATIHFSEDELRRVLFGMYMRKVVTLERPDLAIPQESSRDQPIELLVQPGRDPALEAHERGQPMVTLQIGQRFYTPQEMNASAVPGTILLPGDKALGLPRVPPYLLWRICPLYDPLHGPRHPSEWTTIYDGGDLHRNAGFDRHGRLTGLDPTDTLAEYMDSKGVKKFAASNRVGICVPRFIVFKSEMTFATYGAKSRIKNDFIVSAPAASVGQAGLKEQSQANSAETVSTRFKLGGTFNTLGTSVAGSVKGFKVVSNLRAPASVAATQAGPRPVEPEDGPLLIIKWPDVEIVNVGDIVTFYLKYTNTGGQRIANLVVTDSLSGRFEYVKGSTKADRDAIFTTQPNEAGSMVLRWEFSGDLAPRESGLISFQVKVR